MAAREPQMERHDRMASAHAWTHCHGKGTRRGRLTPGRLDARHTQPLHSAGVPDTGVQRDGGRPDGTGAAP